MKKLTEPILMVDSAEKNADMQYVLGFRTPDPIVFLDCGDVRHVVVPALEAGRARALGTRFRVHTPESLRLRRSERRDLGGWAAALLRKLGIRRVTVPSGFALGTARRLEKRGIVVRVSEARLYPQRERKRSAEIESIRAVQRAAVLAMKAAVAMIAASRPSRGGLLKRGSRILTSETVRAEIARVLLAHDCMGRDTIVAGGDQAADPHCHGEGPLRAGQSIVIDIFPQHLHHGYWGDLTRTVVKGSPHPRLAAMYRAVRAAQRVALSGIRAGASASAIHRRAQAEISRRGFATDLAKDRPEGFIHGTGHGVGLEIHERPVLGSAAGRLRAGNVVTVEPGLYYPGIGGVRIEDTVLVTATGWRRLWPCPEVFAV